MNRRDFLKLTGITIVASMFDLTFPVAAAETLIPNRVRVLHLIETREGKILLPDSVHRIMSMQDSWLRLSSGYVPETAVQPMLPPNQISLAALPAWVEVIAPYAALRQYATADAPLLARPDHGSVLYALRKLDDQHGKAWLQVQYGNTTGWLQLAQVQPALLPDALPDVEAVLEGNRLSLIQNGHTLLQFPIARPLHLPIGEQRIIEKSAAWSTTPYPVWNLITDSGLHLGGVTHHNDFSRLTQSIELPFLAAKVMFGILKIGARLLII